MSARARRLGACLSLVVALLPGCRNQIWLSTDVDAAAEPDVGVPPRDAAVVDVRDVALDDAASVDAADVALDGASAGRACELARVSVARAAEAPPLEQPTFAASGRLESLRYAVWLPPSSSSTATDASRIVVVDREGALLHERSVRVDEPGGAPSSTATLHALATESDAEGFLLLTPTSVRVLDADGTDTSSTAALTTPPSARWQRASGWLDADRFAFVSDTADLRIAVFDVRTSGVTTTTISATNAAAVHLEPGGVTISSAGPSSDVVVYDPDLSGAEVLRKTWDDGSLLGARLLGAGLFGGERTWLAHPPSEFRAAITAYRIEASDAPIMGVTLSLLSPFVASREGPFLAISSANPALVLYAFETHTFSRVTDDVRGPTLFEHERDGAHASVLFFEPAGDGTVSLDLACGLR